MLSSRAVGSTDASLDVLACTAPALPSLAGFAAVEVSLNGKEFTRSGLVFEYGASGAARRVAARRAVLTRGACSGGVTRSHSALRGQLDGRHFDDGATPACCL